VFCYFYIRVGSILKVFITKGPRSDEVVTAARFYFYSFVLKELGQSNSGLTIQSKLEEDSSNTRSPQ
jgi:hypothetical protein